MIDLPQNQRISRRAALKHGLCTATTLALTKPWRVWAAPAPSPAPPTASRARAIIQIWMWGGPAHLDTFDPKPEAGSDYCGPLKSTIETNVPGIRIGGLLPQLAQQADKYAIIRSLTHGINAHETAAYLVQTGRSPGRQVFPACGAVVARFKGYDHGYQGEVPPYIALTEPQGRFSEAGFLGQRYKPFATGGDPNKNPFVVEGLVAEGITDERQRDRRDLLHNLDTLGAAMPEHPAFARLDRCEHNAYDMMFGDARRLFDLGTEPDAMRDRYGRSTFGQSCLMARRLVESGVPYVTINYRGWDTHKQHFDIMRRKLPEMDQAMAALLADLAARGLLDSTIVWWSGEFGRTPRVLWEPPWNGGRGHFGQCFCAVVAGGGFTGGQVLGASDDRGENVADRPVQPRDLLASIYTLMGIDPAGPLPNERGLEVPVLPPPPAGAASGGLLTEIMSLAKTS